ncbi:MAG: ParB N-terminal domain-containing protein [Candidatus Nanopelagicales bacterium]|nr:ParB N-terminal domain-containing protein [Candidatus Nanopelagicales bacterium]MDZ4250093.1 ParB N-terminal domain-containing protein [Candidatus Nanopelagicales bacterium]
MGNGSDTESTQSEPFQCMPALTSEEYAALKADIAANGVRVPIEVDPWGRILDGHHRAQACRDLGIEPPRRTIQVTSDEAARSHALSVNNTGRQLSREQRRGIVAGSLTADPHLSDREHARRCGVSPSTVSTVRAGLIESGQLSKLDSRLGKDGRTRHLPYQPRWAYPSLDLLEDAMAANGITSILMGLEALPMPGMDAEDWDGFCDSLKNYGVLVPIAVTEGGTLVDGRSRLIACLLTGQTPPVETIGLDEDLAGLCISNNLIVRSLTPQDLALSRARRRRTLALTSEDALAEVLNDSAGWLDRKKVARGGIAETLTQIVDDLCDDLDRNPDIGTTPDEIRLWAEPVISQWAGSGS